MRGTDSKWAKRRPATGCVAGTPKSMAVRGYLDGASAPPRAQRAASMRTCTWWLGILLLVCGCTAEAPPEGRERALTTSGGQLVSDHPVAPIVSFWDFDHFPGSRAVPDLLGQHAGYLKGTVPKVKSVPGMVGRAFQFDGTLDYMCTADASGTCVAVPNLTPAQGFTLSAWVRPVANGTAATVMGLPGAYALEVTAQGNVRGSVGGGLGVCESSATLTPGHWHHVAVALDMGDGVVRCFVDGGADGTGVFLGNAIPTSTDPFRVGSGLGTGFFEGAIDEAIVHGAALPSAEIARLHDRAFHHVLSVRDFGARGDGVSDDTVAIQATIDKAITLDSAVEIPTGVYPISEPIVLGLHSYAWEVALRLTASNATLRATQPMSAVLDVDVVAHFTLSGLALDANGFANLGMDAEKVSGSTALIQDVEVSGAVSDGIYCYACQGSTWRNVRSHHNGGSGFFLQGCNAAVLEGAVSENNGVHGFWIDTVPPELGTNSGIISLGDFRSEDNLQHGVLVTANGSMLRDGWIADNGADGIRLEGPGSTYVTGTTIVGHGSGSNRAFKLHEDIASQPAGGGHRLVDNAMFSTGQSSYTDIVNLGSHPATMARNEVLTTAPPPPPAPAAAPPLVVHAAGQINVRNYGAVGDGVTDDAPAIQAAIDAGISSSRHVYIPRGRYGVGTPLMATTAAAFRMIGDWPRLVAIAPMAEVVRLEGGAGLQRINVDASSTATTAVDVHDATAQAELRQVSAQHALGTGIRLIDADTTHVLESSANWNATGFRCVNCRNVLFDSTAAVQGSADGYVIEGTARGVDLEHPWSEGNAGRGLVIDQAFTQARDGWIEGNDLDAIAISAARAEVAGMRIIVASGRRAIVAKAGATTANIVANSLDGGTVGDRTVRDETNDTPSIRHNVYGIVLAKKVLSLFRTPYINECAGIQANTTCIERLQPCPAGTPVIDATLCLP